jgi:serine/threonine-protein kinase
MASVHIGRLRGAAGFGRTVALKRLHAHLAKDPEFVKMFVDEARLASRVRHPNVVPSFDVVAHDDEILIVMDYVHGESLRGLLKSAAEPVALPIAVAIMIDLLEGLHAAHEARTESGEPLDIVHRDVSPPNILVGADGVARVLDFGIAKAARRLHTTGDAASLKGTAGYMAPEQTLGDEVDRRTDVYAAGVVLWELFVGRPLFDGPDPVARLTKLLQGVVPAPSSVRTDLPEWADAIVMRALAGEREARFQTAREMAEALQRACAPASRREVAAWVEEVAGPRLHDRARLVERVEAGDVPEEAATAAPPPERRPRWVLRGAAAGVACAAVGFPLFLLVHSAASKTQTATAHAESAQSAPNLAADPPKPAEVDEPPSPAPASPTAAPRAPKRRGSFARPRSSAPATSCDPPYSVRADGIHVPKPECLRTP